MLLHRLERDLPVHEEGDEEGVDDGYGGRFGGGEDPGDDAAHDDDRGHEAQDRVLGDLERFLEAYTSSPWDSPV